MMGYLKMIRYIDLGTQINDIPEFCFYDTIRDEFLCIGDTYTFENTAELEFYHDDTCPFELARLLNLIPDGIFKGKN